MIQVNEPPKTEQVSGDVLAEREAMAHVIVNAMLDSRPGDRLINEIADALIAAGWRRGGDAAMTVLAREGQHCDEIAAAYRRGQEEMRERAAEAVDVKPMKGGRPTSGPHHSGLRAGRGQAAALIRALPIKGGDDEA